MPFTPWSDLRTTDFASLDRERSVALLPVGATEQHGPHLPLSTDTVLAEEMAKLSGAAAERAEVLLLPAVAVAKSDEHVGFAGTLTLDGPTLLAVLEQIGASVARAGVGRFVCLNAHGGNVPVLQQLCRSLRLKHDMLAVTAGWIGMGFPEGAVPERERAEGIHAGLVETAAMLHFRPDLVDMSKAEHFVPTSSAVAARNEVLRMMGSVTMGWRSEDLHPAGAAGDARGATAELGARLATHSAARFGKLLDEVAAMALPEVFA
ncbi:creatininase family protein [Pseudoruegeria sp. HB172150]|uniref:creatininase family protein n=1 Tax=Pseudoruegeria sp. HB172150 TaxID=2721164 RepID=UPI0015516BE6|nr:creatininase family protein [Pseudoruegeria sp. HB172150]